MHSVQVNAQMSNIKGFLEKTHVFKPFHIIKDTAEKISSAGLNRLFFGLAAGGLILEAFKNPENDNNSDKLNFKDIK